MRNIALYSVCIKVSFADRNCYGDLRAKKMAICIFGIRILMNVLPEKERNTKHQQISQCHATTEDRRSTSFCSLHGQLSQGRMVNFPAFIASKSFDL